MPHPYSVNTVNSVLRQTLGNDTADSIPHFEYDPDEVAARSSEPRLPPIGTPERARLDADHKAMCEGLKRCADVSLWMGRK